MDACRYNYRRRGDHVVKDPALFFERKDYSSNTLYQKIRAEMVSVLTQRKAMNNYSLSTSFQMSYDSGIQNMLDNLKIDLMKMGYADYIELRAYPADGCIHRRSTIFEGVCSVIVVYDYHDMPQFAYMTNEQRDKDILSKHPELAEGLSRMQKN